MVRFGHQRVPPAKAPPQSQVAHVPLSWGLNCVPVRGQPCPEAAGHDQAAKAGGPTAAG